MRAKNITLLALLLLGILTLAGCGLCHHHGSRRCGTPCAVAAGEEPCQVQGDCSKADCRKPCCTKVSAPAAPAQ